METETTTRSEFPKEAKPTIKQTLGSEEKINPKEEDCDNHTVQESRKVNHLSKKASDKKNTEFIWSISCKKISWQLQWEPKKHWWKS